MRRLSQFKFVVFMVVMTVFFINCPLETAKANNDNDLWYWAKRYAPQVSFIKSTVEYLPQRFPSDDPGSGSCTYVHIKKPDHYENGYRFQYWFYYEKDIRIDEKTDKQIVDFITECQQAGELFKDATSISEPWIEHFAKILIDKNLPKAFHKHDWECVEVFVTKLGDKPKSIRYCAHGKIYPMKPDKNNLSGLHPKVRVISGMHGCYPPDPWIPIPSWNDNWEACIEFSLVLWMGGFSNPNYSIETFQQSGEIRKFTEKMKKYNKLDFEDYPYDMPWEPDRNFYY